MTPPEFSRCGCFDTAPLNLLILLALQKDSKTHYNIVSEPGVAGFSRDCQ